MIKSIVLFLIWLLCVQDVSIHSLVIGVIIVLLVRFCAYYTNINSPFNLGIITYIPWLLKEIWVSALSVTKVIWSPKMPINAVFERIITIQQTDAGRVLYANSITLTPGTYTVNLGQEGLLVHSLVKQDIWPVEMDNRISKVVKC